MSNEFENRALEEKELEEYLRRGSEVSQRYHELGARPVPAALDARVLQQAQQRAARNAQRRKWLHWGAPLAFAATALIAVTVVLQPGVREPASVPVMGEAPADRDYEVAAAPRSPPAPPPAEDSISPNAFADPAASEPMLQAAPKPEPSSAPAASSAGVSSERRDSSAAPQPSSQEAAKREQESNSMPALPTEAARTAASADRKAKESASVAAVSDETAVKQRAAEPERSEERRMRGATLEVQRRQTPGSELPAASVAAAAPPPPPTASGSLASGVIPPPKPALQGVSTLEADRALPPPLWVDWIRRFRMDGNLTRAAELLERLRAAHPDFQLPPDLALPERR